MDSSHYNPSYDQWNAPCSSHPPLPPPPLPPPPPPRQPHPDSPSFYLQSIQSGDHYLPPEPAVNQPSSLYSQQPPQQHLQYIPEKFNYESQKVLQPSESLDIFQSALIGYNEDQRLDSWTVDASQGPVDRSPGPNYQYVGINSGLDTSSRSRVKFRILGHARKESGAARIMDRSQLLKEEFDRCFRSSPSHEGARNQRLSVAHNVGRVLYPRKRGDYYHLDRGRREGSNDSKRTTPVKQTQKKSALLRLETPRNHHNGRENARNRSDFNGRRFNSNSFKGREHFGRSDRGLVEKKRGSTPVDRDVSFESNRLVAKRVGSPANAGIHPRRSVTPRSSKARRAFVHDKSEKDYLTEENRNKSILKSHEDLLDRTGTGCKAFSPKGIEMEDNVKTKSKTSPKKLLITWSTAADLCGGSEARIRFAGMSMCSVGSQSCEDAAIDCLPSRNLPVMDVNAGFEERKFIGSSVGSLGCVDKDFEKSSIDASIHCNSKVLGDQVLAKSDSGGIEDDSKGVNKNVDSLSPENDSRRTLPKGSVSSASLDIPNVSPELANANNNVSGDLANAHSFTVGTFTNTMVKSPDMSESRNPTHCEITVNPLAENETGSRTESMETTPLNSAAEMADSRNSDKGKKSCVEDASSSLTKVDVKESSIGLPVERSDGCSGSDELGLAIAVPSEVCMENVSVERLVPDEDLGVTSHHPAEIPSVNPLVAVNEQVQNRTFIQANHSDSRGGIMHEENNCAENIDVDTQEEKTSPSGGTLNYKTPGTDNVAVTGDSVFPCNSVSSSLGRSFRQIRSEIYVAATVGETCEDKPRPKHSSSTNKYRTRGTNIFAFCGDSVPCDSLSNSPRQYRQIRSEVYVPSRVDDTSTYKEKSKPSGGTSKCRSPEADVTSDVGGQEKYSLNRVETDIFDGEAWSSVVNVSGNEILDASGVRLSSRYEIENRKKKSNYSTQKRYSRTLPFVSDTKKDANPPNKRHTWHRKPDTSASPFVAAKPLSSTLFTQPKFPIVTAQPSTSYVRKGNSLLRKPSYGSPGVTLGLPPSAIQLNRIEDKSTGSTSSVGNATGEIATLERQSNPPSDSSTSKVANAIVTSSGKCQLSYSRDHFITGLPESIMDSTTSGEGNVHHSGGDASKTSYTLIQTDYASDCQQKRNHPTLDSSNLKRMVYLKKKANQLIAASDIHGATKGQVPTSDGYFKRNKNQLVRTSASCVNHSPDDALDSRAATTMVSKRSSSSAFSDSAVTRPYKRSKFSLVWTKNDPQSRLRTCHMRYQKILPQLVPWKRVTYWRRLMNSVSGSALRTGSFSNISQKLSMMRKRHTVYTRSTNGYSLRKSKVFSIGGSHLKWSKSSERDSRKANEEATLTVAEFSKNESEKHSGQSTTRMTSRNHLAHDDSPCSGPTENGKVAKRPFILKRLVIGNEEYVRVGNGNQLVREPKKRTRALANEKVRWSLHNARLRLAKKKKKYCQFFTRFGKCNKDDGKCHYVHDPSKIAVCSKFLNGLCANANCKLTHKVIPERMPDCSYFLQGLCNNEACPYRHVHVNPSAAICDGFLKGYCSDGDECRKKHSYTCPDFEATGSCCQGTKCKLHHPKNQSKGRKRKRPTEPSEKTSRGRYFSEAMVVVDRCPTYSADSGIEEGLDFIFLGATEYEAGDNNEIAAGESVSSASEEPGSVYNLIRPVALMQ